MNQLMIVLLFLSGVAPLVHCKYYLIQESKNWTDAVSYCRTSYTDLASIYSDADQLSLQTEAQVHQFSADTWFGVYRDVDWRWSYSNESLGTFTNWEPGAPYTDMCVFMYWNGHWRDYTCSYQFSVMCYDERNTGTSRYVYISTVMGWHDAQSYCRLHHTDLATVRDATENSIMSAKISSYCWVGLYRASTWKWLDQTNHNSINWMPGQPDNTYLYSNCSCLSNFQATVARCLERKPFFCYAVVTGQIQIVRFKVQSDQNMNNPAVEAALLEKIQQKLKEHGMEQNITLKWREQPGGEVFHKIKYDEVEL